MKRLVGFLFLFLWLGCFHPQHYSPFPLLIWPERDTQTLDYRSMMEMKRCGFSIIHANSSREENLTLLDIADSAGVRLLLADTRINTLVQRQKPDTSWALLDSVVRDYGDHPALWGYFIARNPQYNQFSHLAKVVDYFEKIDPSHHAFVSLHSLFRNAKNWGTSDYADYLGDFLETVAPSLLSISHYPVIGFKLHPEYYLSLEMMRKVWVENNIPFWPTVLVANIEDLPLRQHSHIRLQAFSALAYGARGIQFFPYYTVGENGVYQNAMIGPDGEKTRIYTFVRNINREVKQIGRILSQCKSVSVSRTDPRPHGSVFVENAFPVLAIRGGKVLMGIFQNMSNDRYVMLVNRDYTYGAKISLYFDQSVSKIKEIPKNNVAPYVKSWSGNEERSCELLFKAGDGRLFQID